ncbi:MAG: PD-(D/E)XK nuclease family protein [Patescibacteria group bacterium]|nr:PD-(D/E)XK nuclease family protein [Patescibacteria group bacterium]
MKNFITHTKTLLKKLTNFGQTAQNSKTRELIPSSIRELKPAADSFKCPYCFSTNFKKRGLRQKKLEQVQLYQCHDCGKTFTQQITKGKHYPLPAVLQSLSLYHLGYSLEQVCQILKQKYNYDIQPTSISNWLKEFASMCKFSRFRPYALQKYTPKNMTILETLAHQQLYQFRFHRAKCELIIREDIKHSRFGPVQEFLELVPSDCPHQHFTDKKVLRASESPLKFSKTQMIVRAKQNYANQLAQFVLQSVKNRRLRHQALQRFMLFNDSVTVATEVPIFIEKEDLEHLKDQLGFEFYPDSNLPKLITGHIDILQIRNGQVHILDYKPKAEKVRPIEQLTLYAMALSRLTGLRLFEFKCAWFDEQDYFEFYPLHVLKKPQSRRRRRKVYTMEGIYQINQQTDKITNLRPETKGPGVTIN